MPRCQGVPVDATTADEAVDGQAASSKAMPQAKPDHGSARAPRRARLMSKDQAEAFLRALAQGNPAPETELL